MDRLTTLKQIVAQNPSDMFARYALAMEHGKAGEHAEVAAQCDAILEVNPDYAAAYVLGGQALEQLGRTAEAREYYKRGINVTMQLGDGHARDQMQAALDRLG